MVSAYGCNDISKDKLQESKSQCYIQANGIIDQNTLKEAAKCCLTNTVGGKRVFGVPMMQFRKLERWEKKFGRRHRFHLTDDAFDEEPPKCSPNNENDLTKFFNFLDQYKYQRQDSYKSKDTRWDCFLTDDYEDTHGEKNFCKQVLKRFEDVSNGPLKNIKKDVCDGTGGTLLPTIHNSGRTSLVLDDIKKMPHKDGKKVWKKKPLLYLAQNNGITEEYEKRRSSDVHVFQNWNDLTSRVLSVTFQEEEKCIRGTHSCQDIEVVRRIECGCIPAKCSKGRC